MKKLVLTLSLFPALLATACSDPKSSPKSDVIELDKKEKVALESIDAGLAIGSAVPKSTMVASDEGKQSLGAILGDAPAILIFTRSVEWCPYCQTQLKSVNSIVGDLKERGFQVFGVSYDSPDKQDRFSMNQMLDYKMLSDEPSAVIDAFKLRDPQYTEGRAVGVPYASVVVIDKDGKIIGKNVSGDYKKRPTNDQILALIDAI